MNKALLSLTLAFSLITISCKKQVQQTEAEKTGTIISDIVKNEKVSRVFVFENPNINFANTYYAGNAGLEFRIEGGLFYLNNKVWDLGKLKNYVLRRVENTQLLALYIY